MSWTEWFAQLLGTLIGTFVGFGLAMWWDRTKERNKENRDRAETVQSITLELEGIMTRLTVAEAEVSAVEGRPGSAAVEMSLPFLSSSAFEAAVHSGKLTLLPPPLQEELSTIYEQVRLLRAHVDNASTSYAHGSTVEEHVAVLTNATAYLRANGEMLREQLEDALDHLEKAKSPSNES
jgi:hypothetical protein